MCTRRQAGRVQEWSAYFVDVGKRYKGTFRTREEAEKEVRKILQERCVEIKRVCIK